MNKVILMGNLTRDPETKFLPSGQAVCNFGLALNRKFKTGDGQTKEEVTFVDCEAWGKTAESIGKFFTKGRMMLLEGRLKLDQWEQDGQKRSKLKVVADHFGFCGDGQKASGEAEAKPVRGGRPAVQAIDDDSEIPF